MKMIIIICICFSSCFQQPNKEELLAGKEYKYWVNMENNNRIFKRISYFDRGNNTIYYHYSLERKERFYLPDLDDVLYHPFWSILNDSTIIITGDTCKIIKLTKTDFIYRSTSSNKEFHFQVAPSNIIPEKFRKVQPLPEALKGPIDTTETIILW
jgi:hypothetical protein